MRDILEERGLDPAWFGREMGLSPSEVASLLSGEAIVTSALAERLATVLGSTPQFWVTREEHFRKALPKPPGSVTLPS